MKEKLPEIRITPNPHFTDKHTKKLAKILEAVIKKDYEKMRGVFEAITRLRMYVEAFYGTALPEYLTNNILQEVVKLEVNWITQTSGSRRTRQDKRQG